MLAVSRRWRIKRMSAQCRTCRMWAAGRNGETGLCQAPEKSSVRRSFVPGLLLRLATGDVVTTAEASCGEYLPPQQPRIRLRPMLELVR